LQPLVPFAVSPGTTGPVTCATDINQAGRLSEMETMRR
jgi:hypothetical protein